MHILTINTTDKSLQTDFLKTCGAPYLLSYILAFHPLREFRILLTLIYPQINLVSLKSLTPGIIDDHVLIFLEQPTMYIFPH